MYMKKMIFAVLILCLGLSSLSAATPGGTDLDLNLGVEYSFAEGGEMTANLIGVSVMPDISVGKFGIGLDATFRFDLTSGFAFKSDDWVPDYSESPSFLDKAKTTASLYLPLFRYVRYGWKGEPLYIHLGELDSVLIGSGMFVDGYTNTALLPNTRLLGAVLDIDGELFGFPYVGFESFVNDLALLDVFAGRVYTRPLAFLDVPIINELQFGFSGAFDRIPDNHSTAFEDSSDTAITDVQQVSMYGADVMLPLLEANMFSMTLFSDFAMQGPELTSAFRTGARGRMLGFFDYIVDATFPQTGFVPTYFTKTYDTNRNAQYNKLFESGEAGELQESDNYLHGGTGFSFMDDQLIFGVDVTGVVSESGDITDPSMTARLSLGEDLLPMFYFDAYYTKTMTAGGALEDFTSDILNPMENAAISADVTVSYNIVKTTIGISLISDDNGDWTSNVTVAGNLDVGSMLPFLN
jgi:hypothetical protein